MTILFSDNGNSAKNEVYDNKHTLTYVEAAMSELRLKRIDYRQGSIR